MSMSSVPVGISERHHRNIYTTVSTTPPFSALGGIDGLLEGYSQYVRAPGSKPITIQRDTGSSNGDCGSEEDNGSFTSDSGVTSPDMMDDTPVVGYFDRYMSETKDEVSAPSRKHPWTRRKSRDRQKSSKLVDEDFDDALLQADRNECEASDLSTLSSSPAGSIDDENAKVDLNETLLREKFAKLGFVEDEDEIKVGDEDSGTGASEEEMERGPLIRSTSLKTGKTPPSTPGRKKFVRFADVLGLDLFFIKTITQDDLPTVPKSAFSDLQINDLADPSSVSINNSTDSSKNAQAKRFTNWVLQYQRPQICSLVPEFSQPFTARNFLDRVRCQRICLEYCMTSSGAGNLSVTCMIRVLNVSFEKQVILRYTLNEWTTWTDSLASYVPTSSDGWSDKFNVTFSLSSTVTGKCLRPGARILFALKYSANDEEYWDNNMGLNYSLIFRG